MHLALSPMLAGLLVGVVVGLTGSGGGALLTPALVLILHVNAKTAVASDLVATLFMRPVAGAVHLQRGHVRWELVKWLLVGSVPAAFIAGFVAHIAISAAENKTVLEPVVGAALLISASAAMGRRVLATRTGKGNAQKGAALAGRFQVLKVPTVAIGVVGGAVVGFTSVGSGTLMLVALALTYPMLSSNDLVGTDLIQAVPLVGAAALGHLVGGDLHVALTASVVAGGVPGALAGAFAARWIPQMPLGIIVAGVIFASGLALVGWLWSALAIPGLCVLLGILFVVRRRPPDPRRASPAADMTHEGT
ncbi:MAG: sulfite exporter TauE/SafE family protein [Acidimicrobiales bacterium]